MKKQLATAAHTVSTLDRFSGDTELARVLLNRINRLIPQVVSGSPKSEVRSPNVRTSYLAARTSPGVNLMEVCGTHTMAISASGVRRSVDPRLRLTSGPGCPVCVTAQEDLDVAIRLASCPNVIITTFGDMIRVPGSESSLEQEAAHGRDIRVVYSPLEAVKIAQANPRSTVVFIGVGFETTAPTVAAAVKIARAGKLDNFLVLPRFKTMPQALRMIAGAKTTRIDGFILPGHVSTIIGSKPYEFLAEEFNKPCCIVGFELLDILQGIEMLLEQLGGKRLTADGRRPADSCREPLAVSRWPPVVEIQYTRSVTPEGNREAQKLMAEVFRPADAVWRGLGSIPGSGLSFAPGYREFDAQMRLMKSTNDERRTTNDGRRTSKGCRCGDVLLGLIVPNECRMFARACTPEKPLGPCMVSSEGACAAYYKYER
jgi:hydrogenase expression/formation protein HypD